MAPFSAIVETCLSVQDLARAKDFYADLFGHAVMRSDEHRRSLPAMLVRFRHWRRELATARRAPSLLSYRPGDVARNMAIFHLSIRPISRAKGHSAVGQIAYDTRCKLTNSRSGEKHDWSKHKQDVVEWQIIGPKMAPGGLAARSEQAEKQARRSHSGRT